MSERPTPEQIASTYKGGVRVLRRLEQYGYVIVHPDDVKPALCDRLIAINDEVDPVTREKWGPIVPPTAIDWIGNALVDAFLRAGAPAKEAAGCQ